VPLARAFLDHPLVKVGKYFLVPYAAYLSYYYFRLQRPDYLAAATAGLLTLRPAVAVGNPRQVLIIAVPSTGTVQMAATLHNEMGLEMGHETSDAAWHFLRDGTVSGFHSVRFFAPHDTDAGRTKSFATIYGGKEHAHMGFHPAVYRSPVHRCSYHRSWNACLAKECLLALVKEWGCGLRNDYEISFATNLHQVRNPLRTLESLAVKFCVGGLSGTAAVAFLVYASALFPGHDFYGDSCLEATGHFLSAYQTALIAARESGAVGAFYRIEDATACDVVGLAGLRANETTVYGPNHHRIQRLCANEGPDGAAPRIILQKKNKVNTGLVRLGWKDLRGSMHGSRRDGVLKILLHH
jgi:hypothetical protein